MKRILFPFKLQHNLDRHWWHRLFVVLFFLVVFGSGINVWRSLNESDFQGYYACHQQNLDEYMQAPVSQASLNQQKVGAQRCEDSFPIHTSWNFVAGLIFAIIVFYLLQLIYYKVFLYVVFGNQAKQ